MWRSSPPSPPPFHPQLWERATAEERRTLIAAFEGNASIDAAGFAGAFIDDAAGTLWATVLGRNATLTSLNLESNELQSGSLEALAGALAANTTLRELKLANQRKNFSQAAEEKFADGLDANTTLTRVTIDLRSTRARDKINKAIDRNQAAARKAGRLGKANPNPPPPPRPSSQPDAAEAEETAQRAAAEPEVAPELDHSAALQRTARPQRKPRGGAKGGDTAAAAVPVPVS